MVTIIVVSHSWKLANETIKFCNEMKRDNFEIINASGLDENTYGSNPIKIKELIESNFNENGVLIICDIGSSVLNAKTAIDLLDGHYDKSKICIADAPLVEGTLVAITSNSKDATLDILINELKQLKNFDKTN